MCSVLFDNQPGRQADIQTGIIPSANVLSASVILPDMSVLVSGTQSGSVCHHLCRCVLDMAYTVG